MVRPSYGLRPLEFSRSEARGGQSSLIFGARYCVQSGLTSKGREPHSMHLRRLRNVGASIAPDNAETSTIDHRPHSHAASIVRMQSHACWLAASSRGL